VNEAQKTLSTVYEVPAVHQIARFNPEHSKRANSPLANQNCVGSREMSRKSCSAHKRHHLQTFSLLCMKAGVA